MEPLGYLRRLDGSMDHDGVTFVCLLRQSLHCSKLLPHVAW
ncbi:MAG: hypothetical protein RL042_2016 [Nitrospirota bacterium]|jgi:hypothetical protein